MATKGSDTLTFEKLKLESLVVEVRYPLAFLFWDRAGSIFDAIRRAIPAGDFVLQSAQPGKVEILYEKKYDIVVEGVRCYTAAGGYDIDLKLFFEVATTVYQTVIDMLDIDFLDRVGCRQVHSKIFTSAKKANEAILKIPTLAMLRGPIEGSHKDRMISPAAQVRAEDDKAGRTFTIKTGDRDFEIGVPPVFWPDLSTDARVVGAHHSVLSVDIDSYTKGEVSVDMFKLEDWARQQTELAKREAAMFF